VLFVRQSRLREDGHLVLGFGEKKTPVAFVSSCDEFVYTCTLMGESVDEDVATDDTESLHKEAVDEAKVMELDASLVRINSLAHKVLLRLKLDAAFHQGNQKEGEWVSLSTLGADMKLMHPNFTYEEYGHPNLRSALLALPDLYEVKVKGTVTKARVKPSNNQTMEH
jgi:hypothetical protein